MGMRAPTGLPSLSRRSRILLVLALVLAALLLVGPRVIDTYTNWLWFGEVGFRQVFTTTLLTRLVLFLLVGLFVGVVVFLALMLAYRNRPVFVPVAGPNDPIARYRTTVMSRLKLFGIGIPLVFGVISGLVAQTSWITVQLFLHGGDFGVADPQFNLDIGFYTFDLPFYRFVLNWLFVGTLIAFFANLVTHYVFGGIRLAGREGALTRAARIQLAVLAGSFVLFKAIAYWFDRYSLLSSSRKEPIFSGAGFTDINAVLPAKLILLAIALICAAAFFAAIFLRDLRVPALATALLVLSSILVGAVFPLLMEQFSVRPNAAEKERPYIERNIAATRDAYGIGDDVVEYQNYSGESSKNPRESPADITTIANTRLLDPNILSRTFTQQQQLKNFFGFPDTLDIDRYDIDGQLQDYVVAARELAPQSLTGNQTDWINRHTVYTHGNGFVAAPANRVNAAVQDPAAEGASSNSGYPIYTVSDIASEGTKQVIPVDQPRIYYGEVIAKADPDYAIVGAAGAGDREYDTDDSNYTYTGAGGVSVGNWFNRLAFAAKYAERNILFSGAIGDDSKIIFNRDPRDRVQKVAPWLTTDSDSYPAVVDGKIVWIVDGYTTLENYPYAQRASLDGLTADSVESTTGRALPKEEVSYIRNSVKATVDAYDGSVTLYQVDDKDPVLNAWMGVFPDSVKPGSEIPSELRSHFRYPEDLFKVQREMLAKYHVDNPNEFFTNNAFWSVPSDPTGEGGTGSELNQPPYYVLIGDPETGKPSFRLTSAMVGFNRELLSAYISVRSDPDNYGKFTVLQLPTDTQTQGPQQAQTSMVSDARVASDRTLLEQSNEFQYGNLLTLPIADGGILYVEPLYTSRKNAATSTFPQLTKVLVSYREPGADGGVRVGYAPRLSEALDQVFGPGTGTAATAPGGDAADPQPTETPTTGGTVTVPPATTPNQPTAAEVQRLNSALADVRTAQSSGDLSRLGAAFNALQQAIDAYQQ
ncbi:UPF0182 family protein [Rhodococcus sp. G-MC3]|uniref:UPF0182 family protein n=1 Tax=Rhodococcus sp. G-MC3 TaxID=3046209 RepID=UPI0024BAB200|nr:UPF0182 family protein [Rhodococcus sp. G-MC3]MDJ0395236.1 UPF0182 family protein [Rhodococcus sp. G-MC3]